MIDMLNPSGFPAQAVYGVYIVGLLTLAVAGLIVKEVVSMVFKIITERKKDTNRTADNVETNEHRQNLYKDIELLHQQQAKLYEMVMSIAEANQKTLLSIQQLTEALKTSMERQEKFLMSFERTTFQLEQIHAEVMTARRQKKKRG